MAEDVKQDAKESDQTDGNGSTPQAVPEEAASTADDPRQVEAKQNAVRQGEDQAPDWAPFVYDEPVDFPPFSPHTAEERGAQPLNTSSESAAGTAEDVTEGPSREDLLKTGDSSDTEDNEQSKEDEMAQTGKPQPPVREGDKPGSGSQTGSDSGK